MTAFDRYITKTGLISIANGATSVTGVGTSWGGLDRQGSPIFAKPADAASFLVGYVKALDDGQSYDDLELPLDGVYHGEDLVGVEYVLGPPPAIFSGAPQAAIFAYFNAFFRQNAGLFFNKADITDWSIVQPNSLVLDEGTKSIYVWRDGVLDPVYAVGAPWAMQGPWDGGPTASLAIVTGATAVDAALADVFSLSINANTAIQLPTNAPTGTVIDIVGTGDGVHAATFAAGYITSDAFRTANGAKSRIRITVTADSGGTATAATAEMVAFSRDDAVAYGGNFWVSAINGNIDEPLNGSVTWVQMPAGTGPDGPEGHTGVAFAWNTSTSDANPGTGQIAANNPSLSAATKLFISKANAGGSDISGWLATLDDSTNPTIKAYVILTRQGDGKQMIATLSAITDASAYVKADITYIAGETSLSAADDLGLLVLRVGDRGAPGVDGAQGPTAAGLRVLGVVATTGNLPGGASAGDAYKVTANGHIYVWNAGASQWQDIGLLSVYGSLVTPELYGAVGDGSTDDTAAVQAAFNSGKSIFFPNKYKLTDTVDVGRTANRTFWGQGKTTQTFVANMNKPFLQVDATGGNVYWLSFHDMGFDSSNSGTRTSECAIRLTGSVSTNAIAAKFYELGFYGVYAGIFVDKAGISGGEGNVAKGEYRGLWADTGSNGLVPAYGILATTSINNAIIITDCLLQCSEANIEIGNNSIYTGDILILGCEFYNSNPTSGACLRIHGGAYAYNITMVGCQLEGAKYSLDLENIQMLRAVGTNWGGGTLLNLTNCRDVDLGLDEFISPSSLGANVDNWAPTDAAIGIAWAYAKGINIAASAARNITGLVAYGDRKTATLVNTSAFAITLKHASSSSTAANRFACPNNVDYVIPVGGVATVSYDVANSRWRVLSPNLGTAAAQNTGTSGANVPLLNGSNTWSNFNLISAANAPLFKIQRNDDSNVGAIFDFSHNSASPAAGDLIGFFRFFGKDSGGNDTQYASFHADITDTTDGSEDATFAIDTIVAGTNTPQAVFGNGVVLGSPTGGAKGSGTLNATAVYDDNTLLTCMALSEEFLTTGKIDVAYWDSLVPPLVVPARTERRVLTKKVQRQALRRDSSDGSMVLAAVEEDVPVTYLTPVYDAEGNGIGATEEHATETVEIPQRLVPRQHVVARVFQGMLDDGFDPRSPAAYVARLRADHALPGMPRMDEWQQNGISTGELFCRLWLACEMMALVVANHERRLGVLEATA